MSPDNLGQPTTPSQKDNYNPEDYLIRDEDGKLLATNVSENLKRTRELIPDLDEPFLYDFADFLATRTPERLYPEGFATTIVLALYDLQKGIDGFTKKPIDSSLTGQHPIVYDLLALGSLSIIERLYGPEFANEVEIVLKGTNNSENE